MNKDDEIPEAPHISPFKAMRHENEVGVEYWSARELSEILGYTNWRNFKYALDKAKLACLKSNVNPDDHFDATIKMVELGSGAKRKLDDFRLSRFACYLIIENADPTKEIVAQGQSYFALQTHRQEQSDSHVQVDESQKRIYLRNQLVTHNTQLAATARQAGVVRNIDFAIFQDHGYMGLYNGEKAADIHARKELKPNQKILDHMNSEETAANLFRATQTEAKIRREGIKGKERANQAHYEVGRKVRQTIAELGGTMPEELPTPKKSIQQLQKEEEKRRKLGPQLPLFEELEGE